MKPWEETWAVHRDSSRLVVKVADFPGAHGVAMALDASHIERAKLAAAAPDMARVLLDVEWQHRERSEYRRCPTCDGDETTEDEPRTGHRPDCALDAALRKAGVR